MRIDKAYALAHQGVLLDEVEELLQSYGGRGWKCLEKGEDLSSSNEVAARQLAYDKRVAGDLSFVKQCR